MTELQDSLSRSERMQRLLDFNTSREEREPMPDKDKVSRRFLSVTLFMLLLALAVSVTPVADLDVIAHQSTTVVSEPEKQGMLVAGTPHGPIAIDGDANFSDTALLEGWDGDGSPESPYMIDGLDIDLGGGVGHCISISNTRVSFTISDCSFTGASDGAGIYLENVTNGELVNNACNNNSAGINLAASYSNTVFNNNCSSNGIGISLDESDSNTVANNNGGGIDLWFSDSNTVANNTCNRNRIGIILDGSDSNTVADNTCNSNDIGISLDESSYNTVAYNTCNITRIGIYLGYLCGWSNIVADNTCFGNTEHDTVDESELEELAHKQFLAQEFVWFLAGFGMILVASVITFAKLRGMEIHENQKERRE
jgi:parallel beta-helix repeat protein